MNNSEEFVYNLCRKSFLSLWSYIRPTGKNKKELCDILIVCEPNIIIFSVKDVKLSNGSNISTSFDRWRREAVKKSCKQIYGAERWIKTAQFVIKSDKKIGLPFPKGPEIHIHRVAIAFGSEYKVPFNFGDFGKGFIHVCDEKSIRIVLSELNTIQDFVDYLIAKENFSKSGVEIVINGGDEDLLAWYLQNNMTFPINFDLVIIEGSLWEKYIETDEYKNKKSLESISKVWDNLIEVFCRHVLDGTLEFSSELTMAEKAIRVMAKENRFQRVILGKSLTEFMQLSSDKKVRSRLISSPSGVLYVFLATPFSEERKYRVAELGNRCFIALGQNQNFKTVVGIATEKYEGKEEGSYDLFYLHKELWTDKDNANLKEMKKDLGYFKDVKITSSLS